MTLSLIVAASENNVIGDGGRLPWDLPDDLAHFRRKTIGHAVIIGNATYVSILCQLGKPLPGRLNVVLSRRTKSDATNSTVYCSSLQDALAVANTHRATCGQSEVFVAGGASVYRDALGLADRIYLTRVNQTVTGDTRLPNNWLEGFQLINSVSEPASSGPAHVFLEYIRMISD